ncbi:hypothetical protein BKA18_006883 [Streptomyces auratus]
MQVIVEVLRLEPGDVDGEATRKFLATVGFP